MLSLSLPVFLLFLDILGWMPIYDVMLVEEDQIEDQGDVAESELYRIAGDAFPASLEHGVDDQLDQTRDSAREIHEHRVYAPSFRALSLPVHVCLRYVFDDDRDKLEVAERVDLVSH